MIHSDASVDFYIDHHRLPESFATHAGNGVNIREPEQLAAGLAALSGKRVQFDSANSNAWAAQQLIDSGYNLLKLLIQHYYKMLRKTRLKLQA